MATRSSAKKESFPDGLRAVWHKSAPGSVRRAFFSGEDAEGWAAWKRHLARRDGPASLAELLPGQGEPLGWALPDGRDSPPKPAWLDRAERLLADRRLPDPSLEKELLGWLGESAGLPSVGHLHPPPNGRAEVGCALEAVASADAIVRLAARLSPEAWWALLEHLLATVADAGGIELQDDPVVHQLLAGELALTLAYLLPEIVPCRKLKPAARRALSAGLIDLLDGEGLPHGRHLASLRPLLACWTRCRTLGDRLKGGCWTAAAQEQYEWLVRHALRTMRHDGTHVFSNGSAGGWNPGLFKAALQLGGDEDDRDIASLVWPRRKGAARRHVTPPALPEAATHSEWAATAVLRPAWSRSGERLTVVYADQSVRMELSCGKDVLWSGPWELEVRVEGRPFGGSLEQTTTDGRAGPDSDWDEVCWISDEDVDYLELELELRGGLRVQRQMLLAREDHFLLLADAVVGGGRSARGRNRIEYRGRLPLGPGVSFHAADQTREGALVGSKRRARVVPLALPEWRREKRVGELAQRGQGLELCQSTEGRNLYAPLFFDLDRRRPARRLTWRQLTVAESLAVQPNDVAVGYRVAIGKQQWLIYRSLAKKANRTLLGHNLSTEMLAARFDRRGKVEPLIEIE